MSYTNEQLQKIIDTSTALQEANDAHAAAVDRAATSGELVGELNKQLDELTAKAPATSRLRVR